MSLYVLDNAGEFVHMERMDGQVSNNMRTALLKAQTALKIAPAHFDPRRAAQERSGGIPRSAVFFNLLRQSGGIPIVVDGQMIGAVGVGGVAGGGDEVAPSRG